ncbi:MAG: hypothetical protein M1834_006022 [Cirrosporium novae-zelandiae]|nr:MAG: hypothetical protein M1834_006022 [Cirrosporium novae-zelandiae]
MPRNNHSLLVRRLNRSAEHRHLIQALLDATDSPNGSFPSESESKNGNNHSPFNWEVFANRDQIVVNRGANVGNREASSSQNATAHPREAGSEGRADAPTHDQTSSDQILDSTAVQVTRSESLLEPSAQARSDSARHAASVDPETNSRAAVISNLLALLAEQDRRANANPLPTVPGNSQPPEPSTQSGPSNQSPIIITHRMTPVELHRTLREPRPSINAIRRQLSEQINEIIRIMNRPGRITETQLEQIRTILRLIRRAERVIERVRRARSEGIRNETGWEVLPIYRTVEALRSRRHENTVRETFQPLDLDLEQVLFLQFTFSNMSRLEAIQRFRAEFRLSPIARVGMSQALRLATDALDAALLGSYADLWQTTDLREYAWWHRIWRELSFAVYEEEAARE